MMNSTLSRPTPAPAAPGQSAVPAVFRAPRLSDGVRVGFSPVVSNRAFIRAWAARRAPAATPAAARPAT